MTQAEKQENTQSNYSYIMTLMELGKTIKEGRGKAKTTLDLSDWVDNFNQLIDKPEPGQLSIVYSNMSQGSVLNIRLIDNYLLDPLYSYIETEIKKLLESEDWPSGQFKLIKNNKQELIVHEGSVNDQFKEKVINTLPDAIFMDLNLNEGLREFKEIFLKYLNDNQLNYFDEEIGEINNHYVKGVW